MRSFRPLFVDQGRSTPFAAIGHIRVKHAIETGLDQPGLDVDAEHLELRPFNRAERVATRYAPYIGPWNFGALRWHLVRGWVARRAIRQAAASGSIDVVHLVTEQVGFLLGDLPGDVPCVLSFDVLATDWARLKNYLPPDAELPPQIKPVEALERRTLRRAPLSIGWTKTATDRLRRLAPEAPTMTLHPGLDVGAFRPTGRRPAGGPVRLLFVGGRWDEKGGPDLVEAIGHDLGRGIELDVVTTDDVPERPGLRVHSGSPGSSAVAELFARADALCLPTYIDAVPWVVLEAMASGVPVISTDVGSIPEMIGPDAGVTLPPGNVAALRRAVQELAGSAERRRAMGAAGRARVEEVYDARRNVPRLTEALREAAAGPARLPA